MVAARRLKRWRKRLGYTQAEAARLAEIPQPMWSKLESGSAPRVSVATAAKIDRLTDGEIGVLDWVR